MRSSLPSCFVSQEAQGWEQEVGRRQSLIAVEAGVGGVASVQVVPGLSWSPPSQKRRVSGRFCGRRRKGTRQKKMVSVAATRCYVGKQNSSVVCCVSLSRDVSPTPLGSPRCSRARPGSSVAFGVGAFDVTVSIDEVGTGPDGPRGPRKSRLCLQCMCYWFGLVL